MRAAPEPMVFQPLHIGGRAVARNRLWVSAMCQYSAVEGVPQPWHLVHLGSVAVGGAGLVMTEATAVVPEGRLTHYDTGLYTAAQATEWTRIVDFVHAHGALAGVQLAHAGRKASIRRPWQRLRGSLPVEEGGWPTIAPSPVAFGEYRAPGEMDVDDIARVVEEFRASARRAVDAGFDVIEIHGAHGYLPHQFLSPIANQREDGYGGSLSARIRFLAEIVTAVRGVLDGQALMVRLSASDHLPGGWDIEDTVVAVEELRERGADFFDISSGGIDLGAEIHTFPGYQVPFAAEVRRRTGAAVSAVGLINTVAEAEQVLQAGEADAAMLGRAFLRNPRLVLEAAHELGIEPEYWPPQYMRAFPGAIHLATR